MLEVLPESHTEDEQQACMLQTLNELYSALAKQYKDKPALISPSGESISFQQLQEHITNTRQALLARGVQPQERVAVILPQGMEILLSFLSISSFAVFVPLNPDYTESEFSYFLKTTGVKSILIKDDAPPAIEQAALQSGIKVIRLTGYTSESLLFSVMEQGGLKEKKKQVEPSATDIALLLSTSGTTSQAKLVPLSHKNLLVAAENLQSSLQLSADDCCLNMLPPFHIGALLDLLLAPLAAGGKVVVAKDFLPETIFSALLAHKPSWLQAVPTMLHALLKHESAQSEQYFSNEQKSNLRLIRSVSAPLSEELKKQLEKKFAVPVIEIYGMTETTGVICSNPLLKAKAGSVGVPVNQKVRIRDSQGNIARQGVNGEVLVQGDNVFNAYEGVTGDINQGSFFSDWFRTGDEGYFDEEGYLFLVGRIKEIINRGGEKISPSEVDKLVLNFPDVIDAASFAIKHESLGEDIALALVVNKDLDEGALKNYLSEALAPYKVPRKIFYLSEIPKNKNGKILRYKLSEQYGDLKPTQKKDWLAPEHEPAKSLARHWQKLLNVKQVGLQDDFFDLGGDSLNALVFLDEVKKNYQVEIHATSLFENPGLQQFSAYLENRLKEKQRENQQEKTEQVGFIKIAGLPEKINDALISMLAAWKGERRHANSLVVGLNTLGEKPPLFWCVQGYEELAILSRALGENQPVYGMRSLASIPDKNQSHTIPVAKHYA
jgi:acyl-CoA synthetase (AMP-forming)/AMP-acid ligase II/acyl carrier protein